MTILTDLPQTRKEAKEQNSMHYFTGKPCARDHLSARLTSNKACCECKLVTDEIYRQNNLEKFALKMRKRRIVRGDEMRLKTRLSYKRNPGPTKAAAAKQRANLRNACPFWANLEGIKDFYKSCPDGYEVDHVIPLRGKTVSGLHIVENLQYLPWKENRQKSNSFMEN